MKQLMNHLTRKRFRKAACAAAALGIAAGGRAVADRIQQPLPPIGQVTTFAITGDSEASVSMEGADAGIPLDVQTDVSVQRRVAAVTKDGIVTVEQTIPRHEMSVNGQSYQTGDLPKTVITTDASGKVLNSTMDGETSSAVAGISRIQSAIETWQLPNKEFKPGDTWNEPLGIPAPAADKGAAGAQLKETYAGTRQVDGHPVMEFTTHLTQPIQVPITNVKAMSGFRLSGMKVNAVDQKSDYDPVTGLLRNASTTLDLTVAGAMGDAGTPMSVTIHMPLTLRTKIEKVGQAAPAGGTAPEGTPGAPLPTPPHPTP